MIFAVIFLHCYFNAVCTFTLFRIRNSLHRENCICLRCNKDPERIYSSKKNCYHHSWFSDSTFWSSLTKKIVLFLLNWIISHRLSFNVGNESWILNFNVIILIDIEMGEEKTPELENHPGNQFQWSSPIEWSFAKLWRFHVKRCSVRFINHYKCASIQCDNCPHCFG